MSNTVNIGVDSFEYSSLDQQLDALLPAARAFKGGDLAQCLQNSATAAREGAEKTIGMVPLRGRGQYLSDRAKEHKDGGAEAIALLFEKLQLLNAQ